MDANRILLLLTLLGCAVLFARQVRARTRQRPGFAPADSWRLFASTFLHLGPLHLTMNMLGLLVLGPYLERALGAAATSPSTSAPGSWVPSPWWSTTAPPTRRCSWWAPRAASWASSAAPAPCSCAAASGKLRRPLWMNRPLRPADEAYRRG